MSTIKGLYFKLNMDNPRDKCIYDFFTKDSEREEKVDKITLLYSLVYLYIKLNLNKIYGMTCQEEKND